ncbi:hypothetical protein AVEN_132947-1, partial [Araneus ventricosus]
NGPLRRSKSVQFNASANVQLANQKQVICFCGSRDVPTAAR